MYTMRIGQALGLSVIMFVFLMIELGTAYDKIEGTDPGGLLVMFFVGVVMFVAGGTSDG